MAEQKTLAERPFQNQGPAQHVSRAAGYRRNQNLLAASFRLPCSDKVPLHPRYGHHKFLAALSQNKKEAPLPFSQARGEDASQWAHRWMLAQYMTQALSLARNNLAENS